MNPRAEDIVSLLLLLGYKPLTHLEKARIYYHPHVDNHDITAAVSSAIQVTEEGCYFPNSLTKIPHREAWEKILMGTAR